MKEKNKSLLKLNINTGNPLNHTIVLIPPELKIYRGCGEYNFSREAYHPAVTKVKYLLTDVDDTLTEGGTLPSSSLSTLERVERAGIVVIPITGRPAGLV